MMPEPGISYADLIEFMRHKATNSSDISQEFRSVYLSLAVEFSCIRSAIIAKSSNNKVGQENNEQQ